MADGTSGTDPGAQREFQAVVLAALLRDLGPFIQSADGAVAAGGAPGGQAATAETRFMALLAPHLGGLVDQRLLDALVHYEPHASTAAEAPAAPDARTRSLAAILECASALSLGGPDAISNDKSLPPERLRSVFGALDHGCGVPAAAFYRGAAVGAQAGEEAFPIPDGTPDKGEVSRLARAFLRDMEHLAPALAWDNFECVCAHLLALLHKYTWCVPAGRQAPDVSLYDHLRISAALAGCLYRYHADQHNLSEDAVRSTGATDRFALAVGDLSGIQDYLYDLANVGAGGQARRLRARSLFIQLVGEAAAHHLVRSLDLPLHHIILQAGGKFYALLPNQPDRLTQRLADFQKHLDEWCLEEVHGELAVNVAWVAFSDAGLDSAGTGFGSVLQAAGRALAGRKQRRLAASLQQNDRWLEAAFVRPVDFDGAGACASCGRLPRLPDQSEGLCRHCARDTRMGARLPDARYLVYWDSVGATGSADTGVNLPGGVRAALARTPAEIRGRPYLAQRLNAAETLDLPTVPAGFRWLATYIPRQPNGEVADFDWIAGQARGRPILGVLKLDADRMGEAFVFGLKREPGPHLDSIARLAALSRHLETFFAGWVQHLAQTAYPSTYLVYAGGDDLLAVAPWDQALRFARQLAEDYRRFTGHPQLTVSAGIALLKPHAPIGRVAREADTALEASKHTGRDRLTALEATHLWEQWPVVEADKVEVLADAPPTALLYRLREYGGMWTQYRGGDSEQLRMQPLLAYTLARNVDPVRQGRLYTWTSDLVGLRPNDAEQRAKLDRLALVANLAILERPRDTGNAPERNTRNADHPRGRATPHERHRQ